MPKPQTKNILALFAALSLLSTGLSQNLCNENYKQATADYAIGRFASVKELMKPCLSTAKGKDRVGTDERVRALELMALVAIAEDRIDTARAYITDIVRTEPGFEQTPFLVNVTFEELMRNVRNDLLGASVSSVSKKPESLQLAPANVKLVTRQEMMDRGYVDITDVLMDLPGFHVSKVFGQAHANVYQLGYRQENTERTLLMIDGVEENDLWSNWAYFSRQYPLSNIKAIEVIYGPASAMYGPRAFVGAVNILTFDPKELITDKSLHPEPPPKYRKVQLTGFAQQGAFNTRTGDFTLQVRGKSENTRLSKFALQFTGHLYQSDEHDMSEQEFYDYDSTDIDRLSYSRMNMGDPKGTGILSRYFQTFNLPFASPYYTVKRKPSGLIDSILITQAGVDRARSIDRGSYRQKVNGAPIGFSNATNDYSLSLKIRIEDVQIGIRHWKIREGYGFYQDISEAGSMNGSVWSPTGTTMYVKFDKKLSGKISVTNLTNYTRNHLNKNTARVSMVSFGDPQTPLHFAHLLYPDSLLLSRKGFLQSVQNVNPAAQAIAESNLQKPGWRNRYLYYEAQQVRNETRLFYESRRFDMTAGIDMRSTQTQGDYQVYEDFDTDYESPAAFRMKQRNIALARENGVVETVIPGGNIFSILDLGLYGLATFRLSNRFTANLGTRADYNVVRSNAGFGLIITPRLALVYHRDYFSIKFTTSGGQQGVSQWTKYSTGFGRQPNADIEPEKINYADLSVSGRSRKLLKGTRSSILELDLSGNFFDVYDAVGTTEVNDTLINDNIGEYRIFGGMGSLLYRPSRAFNLQANYTFTRAMKTDTLSLIPGSSGRMPIGDIAVHMANLSATYVHGIGGPLRLSLNLRANYVGNRRVGPGTTQFLNYGIDTLGRGVIPAYLVFHGNLGIGLAKFPGMRLDVTVQNLLGYNLLDPVRRTYYHPGAREASGAFNLPWDRPGRPFADANVPFVPQRPRFLLFKLTFDL
jgi:outer membrane receptor protein involved in Fe transport